MALKEFIEELDEEIRTVNSPGFEVEIIETNFVPSFSDPNITYDNLDTNKKKCKRLESCVLYIDIRNSAKISAERRPHTLAKMYSSFIRSMISCARYYGGHVRNIVGDRLMVVFDKELCFTHAVETAILMNSVCQYVLNKRIKSFEFSAGIGIDYGKMLITKSGAIRQGDEKEFYRSLVWLGKPANIASRLTDLANKSGSYTLKGVSEGYYFPFTEKWCWTEATFEEFLGKLKKTFSPKLIHEDDYFSTFITATLGPYYWSNQPILMTKRVYEGYKSENSTSEVVKKGWFSKQSVSVRDYTGDVYGGDVIKIAAKSI